MKDSEEFERKLPNLMAHNIQRAYRQATAPWK